MDIKYSLDVFSFYQYIRFSYFFHKVFPTDKVSTNWNLGCAAPFRNFIDSNDYFSHVWPPGGVIPYMFTTRLRKKCRRTGQPLSCTIATHPTPTSCTSITKLQGTDHGCQHWRNWKERGKGIVGDGNYQNNTHDCGPRKWRNQFDVKPGAACRLIPLMTWWTAFGLFWGSLTMCPSNYFRNYASSWLGCVFALYRPWFQPFD